MATHDATQGAITIGEVVTPKPGEEGLVNIMNAYGVSRALSMLSGEQLPRIC